MRDPFCGPDVTPDQALEALSNLMHAAGFTTSESANILCRFIMAHRAGLEEAAAYKKDAERYRWLRVHSTGPADPWSTHSAPESLDLAVDAAIRSAGEKSPAPKG